MTARVSPAAGSASQNSGGISKEGARSGLRRLQSIIGVAMLASACAGAYLLAADRSLWLLAVSHAVGLVVIIVIDVFLGLLNLSSSKKAYLPSMAAALLAVVLQLGDVATAPQYGMTVAYFASYLFNLWAFDILLALQVGIILVGVVGRPYAQHLARRKTRRGRELDYSRRGFVKSVAGFAALIGLGVVLGSVRLPTPSPSTPTSTQTQSGLPAGAIGNVDTLAVGTPVYFDYPTGYPNILLKKTDGTLSAVSMLCTHVCCQCEYVASRNLIACPCHGSVFDVSGNVLSGPASVALPSVQLRVDGGGNIFPTGVSSAGPCQV